MTLLPLQQQVPSVLPLGPLGNPGTAWQILTFPVPFSLFFFFLLSGQKHLS